MLKKARVELIITYNDKYEDPPSNWDWGAICDLALEESIEVVRYEEIQ